LFFCLWIWASLPVCANNTGLAAFKLFSPLVHTSLWQTDLSILSNQLSVDLCPSHSFRTNKCTTARCLSLVQMCNGAVIFIPCLLGTNELRLKHTQSMSPSDPDLKHDQASAVLQKNTMKIFEYSFTFLIFFAFLFYQLQLYVLQWAVFYAHV
jgi:hypothetical protein